MENFEIIKKKRSVIRRNTTKLVGKAEGHQENPVEHRILRRYLEQLNDRRKELKELDEKIFEHMLRTEDEDDCDTELEETSAYEDKILNALDFICEEMAKLDINPEDHPSVDGNSLHRSASEESIASCASARSINVSSGRVRVKLPKLEIRKFSGKVDKWNEFWDSFSSSVHENRDLANVDKLKYLREFLEEPARSVISGIPMTDSDYATAVDLLKKRYAKPSIIQHAHINELLNLPRIHSEESFPQIRDFRDQIEVHYRGLEALKVNTNTYSSIVVPVLMEKLPRELRYGMIRSLGKSYLDWTLQELIQSLDAELEIRACDFSIKSGEKTDPSNGTKWTKAKDTAKVATASALVTQGKNEACAFCSGRHEAEDCTAHVSLESPRGCKRVPKHILIEKGVLQKATGSPLERETGRKSTAASLLKFDDDEPTQGYEGPNLQAAAAHGDVLAGAQERTTPFSPQQQKKGGEQPNFAAWRT